MLDTPAVNLTVSDTLYAQFGARLLMTRPALRGNCPPW